MTLPPPPRILSLQVQNYRALRDYVSVTRVGDDGLAREFRASRQALLLPGDVVTVFERRF